MAAALFQLNGALKMSERLTREQALNSVTEWPKSSFAAPIVSGLYGWHWSRLASGTLTLESTAGDVAITLSDWKGRGSQQLADVSRERDVLAEALRNVVTATGAIDGESLHSGPDLIIGADAAIEWIKEVKRVL